jgi:hypothetical protein
MARNEGDGTRKDGRGKDGARDGGGDAPRNRVFPTRKGPRVSGPPGDPGDARTTDKPWSKAVPIEARVRRDGKPVPLLVRKVVAHKDTIGMKDTEFNRIMGRFNYIHQLECFAGTLDYEQVMVLSRLWGIDPLYFIDDAIPVRTPAPHVGDHGDGGLASRAAGYGISPEEAEGYLYAASVAKKAGINPDQLFNVVLAASRERAEFLAARDRRPDGPDMINGIDPTKEAGKGRRRSGA